MSLFEKVYSLCTENHGLVTSFEATALGVSRSEMARWTRAGRLTKVGHGIYRVTQYPISDEDAFAVAVACLGRHAYLCGESVLALFDLAPTNPRFIHVAITGRCRRKVADGIRVERGAPGYVAAVRNGMPVEHPADAIRRCIGRLMPERLEAAAEEAYRRGLVTTSAMRDALLEEIRHVD